MNPKAVAIVLASAREMETFAARPTLAKAPRKAVVTRLGSDRFGGAPLAASEVEQA